MVFAKGVVFNGDVVVKTAGSGLKTLAVDTYGMEGGEKAAVDLSVAAPRHRVVCYDFRGSAVVRVFLIVFALARSTALVLVLVFVPVLVFALLFSLFSLSSLSSSSSSSESSSSDIVIVVVVIVVPVVVRVVVDWQCLDHFWPLLSPPGSRGVSFRDARRATRQPQVRDFNPQRDHLPSFFCEKMLGHCDQRVPIRPAIVRFRPTSA